MKTIVILGGGVGGIVTANELCKHLNPEHKIIVIEKNSVHSFAPSFLWLMTGTRKKEEITTGLFRLLNKRIEIVNEEVLSIKTGEKIVETSGRKISFDYLVVALGADIHPANLPGLPREAHNYYSMDGAEKLYKSLQEFEKGKVALVIASLPYKCPAAPYEGALLISDFFEKKGKRNNIDISIYTP